jgi:hypothetical protein
MFYPASGHPGATPSSITVPTVNPGYRPAQRLVFAFALATLGCGPTLLAGRLTEPGSIAPMTDATLTVAAGRIFVDERTAKFGMDEDSVLAVELGVTNGDREPYSLSAASISCWLELAPDRPAETRSLTPAGGGEGPFPQGEALDDLKLGSVSIPAGQTRSYWVVFRGYRYPGSDVPRKVTISLPDARGRRVELVIADPARGQLRWEVAPLAGTMIYGIQNIALMGPALDGMGMTALIGNVSRAGPILWDFALTSRTFVLQEGGLMSPTSTFSGLGVSAHVTLPLAGWGAWQDPRQFGVYAGGEAQVLVPVQRTRQPGEPMPQPNVYGALIAEGGIEFDIGTLRPAATPFPLSFTGLSAPRWSLRFGYTYWRAGGGDSHGYVSALRLAF